MLKRFLEKLDSLDAFEFDAISVSVDTKIALDRSAVLAGIEKFTKLFPSLTELEEAENASVLILRPKDEEAQIRFHIDSLETFRFIWGGNEIGEFPSTQIQAIINIIETFSIDQINIDYVDVLFLCTSEILGNQYKLIREAFLNPSTIGSIFEPANYLSNDLLVRGYLGSGVKGYISVTSNVADREIIEDTYEDDTLTAVLGIAQTDISHGTNLSNILDELFLMAESFLRTRYIPHVLKPLNSMLLSLNDPET